jgi:hypothetical protein
VKGFKPACRVFVDNLAFFLLPVEMRTLGRTKKEGVP